MLGLCAIYRDTLDNYVSLGNNGDRSLIVTQIEIIDSFRSRQPCGCSNRLFLSIEHVHWSSATVKQRSESLCPIDRSKGPWCHSLFECSYGRCLSTWGRRSILLDHLPRSRFASISNVEKIEPLSLSLGPIVALNVWQNDTRTKSDFYLRHCILYDIVRHRTYYFCCYSWLSLRKSINTINELFYVAQEVDQKAFGHLFLCTYAWLIYHYFLIHSVFKKQRMNTLRRLFRLQLYFCLIILQLYLIHWILLSCQNRTKNQRCLSIFPSFSLLVDQSFVKAGWSTIYQVNWYDDEKDGSGRKWFDSLCTVVFRSFVAISSPRWLWAWLWVFSLLYLLHGSSGVPHFSPTVLNSTGNCSMLQRTTNLFTICTVFCTH